jgi:hypothetical protein
MSHIATIDLEIKDLDAIEAACKELELELVRNQKTFRWYGQFMGDYPADSRLSVKDYGKCEHAIKMKADKHAYEIGLVKNPTGNGYLLAFDHFAQSNKITKLTGGIHLPKLRQLYAANVAAKAATKAGWKNVKVEWNQTTKRPMVTGLRY